jgi:hypothetical protein
MVLQLEVVMKLKYLLVRLLSDGGQEIYVSEIHFQARWCAENFERKNLLIQRKSCAAQRVG